MAFPRFPPGRCNMTSLLRDETRIATCLFYLIFGFRGFPDTSCAPITGSKPRNFFPRSTLRKKYRRQCFQCGKCRLCVMMCFNAINLIRGKTQSDEWFSL